MPIKPNINKEKYGENSNLIPKRPSVANGKLFCAKAKEKNKKKFTFKFFLISCMVCVSLVFIGFSAAFVITNYFVEYPVDLDTPTIQVVNLYNGTVVSSSIVENATSYEFVISNGQDENSFLSKTNSIFLGNYLNRAGVYNVKARAVAGKRKYFSEFSNTVNVTNYQNLSTPQIYIENAEPIIENNKIVGYKNSQNKENDVLIWESIVGAKSYMIIYGINATSGDYLYAEIPAEDNYTSFDLNNIYEMGAGQYEIKVIAVAEDNSYYLNSEPSNKINISYFATAPTPIDCNFNISQNRLTFKTTYSNYADKFEIKIQYSQNLEIEYFTLSANNIITSRGNYIEYLADITPLKQNEILNMFIRTKPSNEFAISSDWVKVRMS